MVAPELNADENLESYMSSGMVGASVTYYSVRAGMNRAGTVSSDLGSGLYELAILNSVGRTVLVRRRIENFQLV